MFYGMSIPFQKKFWHFAILLSLYSFTIPLLNRRFMSDAVSLVVSRVIIVIRVIIHRRGRRYARMGERVRVDGAAHSLIAHVGVYLGRVQLFMTEDILQNPHIDVPRTVHQRRRRVTQLVRRISLVPEPCLVKVLVDHPLHRLVADPCVPRGQEQRVLVAYLRVRGAHREVFFYRLAAGVVQVYHTLLIALSDDPHRRYSAVDVREIDPAELRETHPAVQEQRQYAVVPLTRLRLRVAENRAEKRLALGEGQKLRQGFLFLRSLDGLCRSS